MTLSSPVADIGGTGMATPPRPGGRASSPAGSARPHFLQQPAVAVRIADGGERAVVAALRIGPVNAGCRACVVEDTALVVEDLVGVDTAAGEIGVSGFDVDDGDAAPASSRVPRRSRP